MIHLSLVAVHPSLVAIHLSLAAIQLSLVAIHLSLAAIHLSLELHLPNPVAHHQNLRLPVLLLNPEIRATPAWNILKIPQSGWFAD